MGSESLAIHRSAYKHGISREDILNAARHSLVEAAIPTPPGAILVLGWDTKLALLELIVVDPFGPDAIVIHAMPMREKFRKLLPRS